MRIGRLAAALLAVALLVAACAPEADRGPALDRLDGSSIPIAELEQQIGELMATSGVPGLSLAVIEDGAVAYADAFGVRDDRKTAPVDTATVFGALSWSKTMFAYVVMQLVDEGAIDLDTPLTEYFGQPIHTLEDYGDLPEDGPQDRLTARLVLTHRTGLPNWRWLTEDGKLQFIFEPGTRFGYSGEGIRLLQRAVEKVTGTSLDDLARQRVFEPFGMTHSAARWAAAMDSNFAMSHDLVQGAHGRNVFDEAGAAGSFETTPTDYAKFLIAVMNGTGLSDEARDAMIGPGTPMRHERMFGPGVFTPSDAFANVSWGIGFGVVQTDHGRAFFHTGHDRGCANYAVVYPDERIGVAIMGNAEEVEKIIPAITRLSIGDTGSPFPLFAYPEPITPGQG